MPAIFKSELFWAAFGGVIALVGLLWTPLGSLIPFFRNRRLQKTLIEERRFFEKNKPDLNQSEELTNYITTIKNALQTIGNIGPKDVNAIKVDFRRLIGELRATHQTLVNMLKPFRTENAKKFFEDFDSTLQELDTLWLVDGRYRHDARTHCGDVEQIVEGIVSKIEPSGDVSQTQITDLQRIGWSMSSLDTDIIVPVMDEVLLKTKTEFGLIRCAIRDGNKTRAIRLKEKLRFDTDNLFQQLNVALDSMNELQTRL